MNRLLHLIAFVGILCAAQVPTPALAQTECVTLRNGQTACPPADSKCVKDRYGEWFCSGAGGDAVLNINGNPVCGAGACVKDLNGEFQCSTQARGAAAIDLASRAVCSAGCEAASASRCTALTR